MTEATESPLNAEQSARQAALMAVRDVLQTGNVWSGGHMTYLAEWILNGSPDTDEPEITGETSDGFHRMLLTAALFSAWHNLQSELPGWQYNMHKSWSHSDGRSCGEALGAEHGSWFIVVAQLPTGRISYHYQREHWDLFGIPERDRAAVLGGHTSDDVTQRLEHFLRNS